MVTNAEILSDPEYSDEDAPPVDHINADEGRCYLVFLLVPLTYGGADLLEDYELDTDVRREGNACLDQSILTLSLHRISTLSIAVSHPSQLFVSIVSLRLRCVLEIYHANRAGLIQLPHRSYASVRIRSRTSNFHPILAQIYGSSISTTTSSRISEAWMAWYTLRAWI